jgi:capsular polysaccharide biosynthesis protein
VNAGGGEANDGEQGEQADGEHMVSDEDETVLPPDDSTDLAERRWAGDGAGTAEESLDLDVGLTSMGFIRAALRRSARLLCVTAVVGLIAGIGVFAKFPPYYQASTSLLLTNPAGSVPGTAILDDQAIAQSRTVAGEALRALGLRESPAAFIGHYTVSIVTDRVLLIIVKARSSEVAVRQANALASAFLAFQAHLLNTQEQLVNASLQRQVTRSQQHINSLNQQIRQLSAQHGSSVQHAELSSLQAEQSQALAALNVLQQTVTGAKYNALAANTSQLRGSLVLDPAAPVKKSRTKSLLLDAVGGLFAGLAIGLSIIVIRAFVSDRLRRRDDVAAALGAPVNLSVGVVRLSRWRPSRRGLATARDPDIQRIVRYLGSIVPPDSSSFASLAVVPVDDVRLPAVCLASLAILCAKQALQVVVVDWCSGAPAARLLGATATGVQEVTVQGARLSVAVPEGTGVTSAGFPAPGSRGVQAADPAAADCASADLVLTLAALDPALGGQHLADWATDVVAMVTAGRSSAVRIQAVGQMIRLAGAPRFSAVLVGTDKTDESLGVFYPEPIDHAENRAYSAAGAADPELAEDAPDLVPLIGHPADQWDAADEPAARPRRGRRPQAGPRLADSLDGHRQARLPRWAGGRGRSSAGRVGNGAN